MARRYESSVRKAQSDATRLALLAACEVLFLEGPIETVTIPNLARRAGVSAPTAYRYFPTQDALLTAFIEHFRERIGMRHADLARVPPGRVPEVVRHNYEHYEREASVLRRMMESPSYERVRLAKKVDRAGALLETWGAASSASERALRERLGPLYLLVTPAAWRWLRDTWGLDLRAAARGAEWAVSVLCGELADLQRAESAPRRKTAVRNQPAKRPSPARPQKPRPRKERS